MTNFPGSSKLIDINNQGVEFCPKMLPFYTRQFNAYSCSVASVATVLNTILASLQKSLMTPPVSQNELLKRVHAANWKERVSTGGFEGKRGLTVHELGMVMKATLNTFKIPFKGLHTVPIHKKLEHLEKEKQLLFALLTNYCHNENHYIIAHFTQGVYTGDWFGGHISPVGSFDPTSCSVLMLDVDEEIEDPYWVPFERFFEGLLGENKTTGVYGGGYVSIFV